MDMEKCVSCDNIREAVCVETKKIYDSCRDRDCLEDLRVYLSKCGQEIIDRAVSVKPRCAEVLWVYVDAEPVSFNRGYYQVDIRYYFKVSFDVYCTTGRPVCVDGLCTFCKRAILYGSDGSAKIFSSRYIPSAADLQRGMRTNAPEVSVEVAAYKKRCGIYLVYCILISFQTKSVDYLL